MMRYTGGPGRERQHGFILVTSLVFLVVLTLLAVTALNSSTLQERMATNQRAKAQALQNANSALVYVENILGAPQFLDCNPVMQAGATPPKSCDDALVSLPINSPGIGTPHDSGHFMADAFWNTSAVGTYKPAADDGQPVAFVVEYLSDLSGNLDPTVGAQTLYFRITARVKRQRGALAFVQSVYEVQR